MANRDATLDGFDDSSRLSQAEIRQLALQAFEELREGVKRAEVDAALAQRSPAPIFESAAWVSFTDKLAEIFKSDPNSPLYRTMISAAQRALTSTPAIVSPASFSFEPVFARARDWLDREGARLVTVVSEGTKAAIRETIQNAFAEPLGIRQAARHILKIKGFGLSAPANRSFNRYAAGLMARELPGSENLSEKQIQHLINVRYGKLRRDRAKLIAKTESRNAAAAAQRELWSESVTQDQLDSDLYVLEWVTRVIRVCPRCQALDGKTAEINGGTFTSDTIVGAGKFNGTQIVIERPTVHPNCNCALRVIRRPDAPVEAAARQVVRVRIVLVEQAGGSWTVKGNPLPLGS